MTKTTLICVLLLSGCLSLYAQKGVYQNLDEAIRAPLKVKALILNNKGITKLPIEISKMEKLEKISLAYNKDLDVADVINKLSQLPKLRELDISFCEITSIPKEIGSLTQLRVLKVGANKLTNLPEQIGNLSQLNELVFSQFPESDFRAFSPEQKKEIISMLSECKILLVDYFGPVHGNYRLGKRSVQVTLSNVDSL